MDWALCTYGNCITIWQWYAPHQAIRETCARTDECHILQAPFVCYKVTHWKEETLYTQSLGLSQLKVTKRHLQRHL